MLQVFFSMSNPDFNMSIFGALFVDYRKATDTSMLLLDPYALLKVIIISFLQRLWNGILYHLHARITCFLSCGFVLLIFLSLSNKITS